VLGERVRNGPAAATRLDRPALAQENKLMMNLSSGVRTSRRHAVDGVIDAVHCIRFRISIPPSR
jgi:hypothetical protein